MRVAWAECLFGEAWRVGGDGLVSVLVPVVGLFVAVVRAAESEFHFELLLYVDEIEVIFDTVGVPGEDFDHASIACLDAPLVPLAGGPRVGIAMRSAEGLDQGFERQVEWGLAFGEKECGGSAGGLGLARADCFADLLD